MNILIVPEDYRKDGPVFKLLIAAMMKACGQPSAKVVVLRDPLLGGVREALNWERLREIVTERRDFEIILLCIDRDGDANRRQALDRLEQLAAEISQPRRVFIAENAWQEVEVWILAGMRDLPPDWSWQSIREEPDAKERYFLPYAEARGFLGTRDDGRQILAREAAQHYPRIRQLCPEDIGSLHDRITAWLANP